MVELCAAVNEELPGVERRAAHALSRRPRRPLRPGTHGRAGHRRATGGALIAVAAVGRAVGGAAGSARRLRDEQLEPRALRRARGRAAAPLRGAGVRTALLTNGPSWMQRHKVELLGLEPQLDAIGISEEIGVAKPDPAAFAGALELLGTAPQETVMVGDHVDWTSVARSGPACAARSGSRATRRARAAARRPARRRLAGVPAALAALSPPRERSPPSGPAGSTSSASTPTTTTGCACRSPSRRA